MIGTERELFEAQAEVYHKTHYRWEWLLSRTLGYTILSSLLAIYVFWFEAGKEQPPAVYAVLTVTWIVLMTLALVWFDFRTRVSYEKWADVQQRLARHFLISVISFIVAVGIAFSIHGIAGAFGVSNPGNGPIAVTPAKGLHQPTQPSSVNFAQPDKKKDKAPKSKAPAKSAPAKSAPAKGTTPAKTPAKPAPKPNNGKPAPTGKPAATNSKPAAKPAATKPSAKPTAGKVKPPGRVIAQPAHPYRRMRRRRRTRYPAVRYVASTVPFPHKPSRKSLLHYDPYSSVDQAAREQRYGSTPPGD